MLSLYFICALLLSATAVAVSPFESKLVPLRYNPSPSPASTNPLPPTTPTAAPAKCGLDSYDFSQLMTSDWAGLASDYAEIYYINLCHTVQSLWCTLNPGTAAVQVCQVSPSDTQYTYNLMSNDTASTKWSYINGQDATDGVQFTAQTGEPSGGCPQSGRRITVGKLVCGNSTGIISEVVEGPACTYTMTLPNQLVCQAGQPTDRYAADVERVQQSVQLITKAMAAQPTANYKVEKHWSGSLCLGC